MNKKSVEEKSIPFTHNERWSNEKQIKRMIDWCREWEVTNKKLGIGVGPNSLVNWPQNNRLTVDSSQTTVDSSIFKGSYYRFRRLQFSKSFNLALPLFTHASDGRTYSLLDWKLDLICIQFYLYKNYAHLNLIPWA